MKKHTLQLFLVLILFSVVALNGTSVAGKPAATGFIRLSWNAPRAAYPDSLHPRLLLSFDGSVPDAGRELLPLFVRTFDFNDRTDSVAAIHLAGTRYTEVPENWLTGVSGISELEEDVVPAYQVTEQRKVTRLEVSFIPLRKNSATGKIERLVSFGLDVQVVPRLHPLNASAGVQYAEHSVLASGTWYKLAIPASGMYRLTSDDLKKAGIDPAGIDPANIRIFGNGGGMLPEANATYRIDDLAENAILVTGAEDGHFDPSDQIIFYAQGPDALTFNKVDNSLHIRKNVYSDRSYYFICFDKGAGKRIGTVPSVGGAATFIADRFADCALYEKEDTNLIKSGREWWDRKVFDITTERKYGFNFPNIDNQNPVSVTAYVAARSTTGNTSFVVSAGGNDLMTLGIEGVNEGFENVFANVRKGTASFNTGNSTFDVTLNYYKSSSSSVGYLNYIEVNATRLLSMSGSQMGFRSTAAISENAVTEFRLAGNGQDVTLWEVTDPTNAGKVETTLSGGTYTFRLPTTSLREFMAFDGRTFLVPEFAGRVANQDLHGTPVPDYIIVSHPSYATEAARLADFHTQYGGLSVLVVTPEQVYNEFSSGAQDVTAIRDFVRMMYNRAGSQQAPKYLLLFGDASYDYKDRVPNNTNFVPSFESVESLSPVSSFVTDDYFGILGESEGQSANGTLDIGIGRLPVDNAAEANASVNKILHYCMGGDAVRNDWRNVVTFVGDDQNEGGNLFIEDSEDLARIIETQHRDYNVDKIYSDAYTMVSTPGGARYPDVNDAINKRVGKGSLIMNYVGHGGEVGWAHERILEVPDIKAWRNINNMPVFVTATCEFSRFDDPWRVSAGEWVFLNGNGGGIALFTTTRLTFAGTNKSLLVNFYNDLFDKPNGQYMKLGDLLVASKTGMGSSPNIHAFVLLGDPAMQLAYPDMHVATTSINGHSGAGAADTLKALSAVTITGEVQNSDGSRATDFNGTVFPTVFDKASEIWTKANTGEYPPVQFYLRKNPVYKGKVDVVAGAFSFTFIVPKDIAYQYGQGKISYYARNESTDATGHDFAITVGGYNNEAQPDDQGPEISLYINDRNFRSGGITGPLPMLLAYIADTSGINAVGNGIGHDITAVLDGSTSTPMVLNDYYVSDLNTYKSGALNYPLGTLAAGRHTLTLKAWDVQNNSGSATIDFTVISGSQFALQDLLTYPNPMQDHTTFTWETNQADQQVTAEIRIFSLSGRPVKTIETIFWASGFREASVEWDGTQDNGAKIASGMYVYTVTLTGTDGSTAASSSRLVVIR